MSDSHFLPLHCRQERTDCREAVAFSPWGKTIVFTFLPEKLMLNTSKGIMPLKEQIEPKVGTFFAHTSPTLGVRNHNPLNIRYLATNKWLGLSKTTPNVKGFCHFDCMDYGLRAAIILLLNYIRKRGCTTPRQIITRWAPPTENNTELYIKCVCGRADIHPDRPVPTEGSAFNRLVIAMARQESGIHLTEGDIERIRTTFSIK